MSRCPAPRSGLLLVLGVALASGGCIEERLLVEVTTVVRADGSCSRRVEYRLEHVEKDGTRVPLDPEKDALRLFHRFPQGEAWTVRDEVASDSHTVVAEAALSSPNEIGSDYWRALAPRASPAHNRVSFAMDRGEDAAVYEYAETFVDPASPLAGLKMLSQLLSRRENDFASALARKLGRTAPPRGDTRRAYREHFARPFAVAVASLAKRPFYGPRERQETDDLMDRLTDLQKDLAEALAAQTPGADPDAVSKALDETIESFAESLDREVTG
ncbi:MAG: hypothetical protein DMF79_09755, partial [Acidobacteria bacterium]